MQSLCELFLTSVCVRLHGTTETDFSSMHDSYTLSKSGTKGIRYCPINRGGLKPSRDAKQMRRNTRTVSTFCFKAVSGPQFRHWIP